MELTVSNRNRRRWIWRIAFLTVAVLVPVCCIPEMRSKSGINVSVKDCPFHIPEQAREICYYRCAACGPASYCEFSVPLDAFMKWAEKQGWPVKRVEDGCYSIARYTIYVPELQSSEAQNHYAVVKRGWFCDDMIDPDTGVHIAYDLDTGRAYCYYQSR